MSALHNLKDAWRRNWRLYKHRPEPLWARCVVVSAIGLGFGLVLALAIGGFTGRLVDRRWWGEILLPAVFVAVFIAWTTKLSFRLGELTLSQATLDRLNGRPGLGNALFFSVLGIVGGLIGWSLALNLLGWIINQDVWSRAWRGVPSLFEFLALSLLFSGFGAWLASTRWRAQQLRLQATEAQLKLLQAQIEPHFLFNTLANVRSLIDCEPQRAGELLDLFTDHLRGSLGAMRSELVPLEREFELVGQYLRLMQLRMCERLRFRLELPEALRRAQVPPLLLQPLAENAIQHGLECQIEGGEVCISATLAEGSLLLRVCDDGRGMDAETRLDRRQRRGAGVALANIRERLCSRYGEAARLSLNPRLPRGTEAEILLPLSPAPN